MTNFNQKFFDLLNFSLVNVQFNPSGLDAVLNVLGQRSDTARRDSLNHNCIVNGLPFTWRFFKGYGDDAKEVKVLTFPMKKISTGWCFCLDIDEDGNIFVSEGKNTNRTSIKLSDLNALSHRTQQEMRDYLEVLTSTDGHINNMFIAAEKHLPITDTWHRLERDLDADVNHQWELYKHEAIRQLSRDKEVRYNDDIKKLFVLSDGKPIDGTFDRVVFVISDLQHDDEDGWYRYVNVVTNHSFMGQEYFDEPGSIMYQYDKETHQYSVHPDSKEYWNWLPCFDQMEKVMAELGKREANDKEGEQEEWSYPVRYFGFTDGSSEGQLVTFWSAIPEGLRPHIFVTYESPWREDKKDGLVFFDDVEDIELYRGNNDPKKKAGKCELPDQIGDMVTFKHNHDKEFPRPED